MLKIEKLSLYFGDLNVLNDITLQVSRGELVCLCGESGCGKSSLLKAIQGFVDTDGRIEVGGKRLDDSTIDAIRRITAYIPQDLSLPYDSVEKLVTSLFELRVNRNINFSTEMLFPDWALLGLDSSLWNKKTNEISGGQRQRIMLSIAGLTGKSLILADEPTSALDTESSLLVAKYFRMLTSERNMAILTTSHSERFAQECDKIIKL